MRPCTRHGESALHDGGCRAVSAMLRIHVHMLYVPVRQVSRTEGRYRRDRATPKRYPTVMQPDSHTTRKCHGDSAASHWYHATMRHTCHTAGRYSRNLAASERHHATMQSASHTASRYRRNLATPEGYPVWHATGQSHSTQIPQGFHRITPLSGHHVTGQLQGWQIATQTTEETQGPTAMRLVSHSKYHQNSATH